MDNYFVKMTVAAFDFTNEGLQQQDKIFVSLE